MGKKSRFSQRLKDSIVYEHKSQMNYLLKNESKELNTLFNNPIQNLNPEIESKKFIVSYSHSREDDLKIRHYEDKIQNKIASIEDYMSLDILYLQLDYRKEHKKLFRQIISLFPDAPFIPFLEGYENFFYIKHNRKIKQLFNQALERNFEHPLVYTTYGNLYNREKCPKLAKEMFNKALSIDPTFSVAWHNLGYLAFQEKKLTLAEELYLRSLYSNWRYFKGYLGLYQSLEAQKRRPPITRKSLTHISNLQSLMFQFFYMIPLTFAAYIPDIINCVYILTFTVEEFNYIINISPEEQHKWQEKLEMLWVPFNSIPFEELWEKREILYRKLIEFGQKIKKMLENKRNKVAKLLLTS